MYPWLQATFNELLQRIEHDKLHHGLLFVADHGVGEQSLIDQLAKSLVCKHKNACSNCKACSLYEAHSHPDVKEVISDKPSIGVDLIRNVTEFVTTTSQLLGNKVIIINDIHKMTESASNSLLKTLEEPSSNTFLLLSSNQPDALLATIKSRCEKIRLSLPSTEQSLAWLSQQSQIAVSEDGLKAYSGSPLLYLKALEDSAPDYHSFADDLQTLYSEHYAATALAQKWQNNPEQALKWTYQWSVAQYSAALQNNASLAELEEISTISNECVALSAKVNQAGINKLLILQRIFNLIQHNRSDTCL